MLKEDEMVLDDQNPSEQEEELELDEAEATDETVDEDNQGNDPFDEIEDVEVAVKELKKQRSILQRLKRKIKPEEKKEVSKEEPVLPVDNQNFLTKKELSLLREKLRRLMRQSGRHLPFFR